MQRLHVSDNRRYLAYEDGRPFFYLGDTAWELFHRLDREEADTYLQDRAAKRYTVIHADYYVDGSGHLHLEVYKSEASYQKGEAPIIVADYYISADGSGTGTITDRGTSYEIVFNESGQADITLDDKIININLFDSSGKE